MQKALGSFSVCFTLIIAISSMFSCAYIKRPFYKKLNRGNWENDTLILEYEELPKPVQDTFISFYTNYYNSNESEAYPELISLDSAIQMCFIKYNTFPSGELLDPVGYYFRIGKKNFFFDYNEFRTPIILYDGSLYYFSGKQQSKKKKFSREYDADYESKFYVFYKLSNRTKRRILSNSKKECDKRASGYDFTSPLLTQ